MEINYRKPASLANNNVNCIGFYWYKFNKLQKCYEMLKNFLNFLVWLFFDPFLCCRRVPLSLKSTIKKKCAEENSRWITFSITLLYPTIDFTCLVNLWHNVKFNNILWNRRGHKSSNIIYFKSSGLDPICFAQILHHTFESLQVIFISVIVRRSYRPVRVLLSIFYPYFIQILSR